MAKWLSYNKVDQEYIATLRYSVCTCFKDKLHSSRNFNSAVIVDCTNLQASTFKDHTSQTSVSDDALKKTQSRDVSAYMSIAKPLSTLNTDLEAKKLRSLLSCT